MTLVSIIGILKILVPFVLGWLTKHGMVKLADAQAKTESDEKKARDPLTANDVTDLDQI